MGDDSTGEEYEKVIVRAKNELGRRTTALLLKRVMEAQDARSKESKLSYEHARMETLGAALGDLPAELAAARDAVMDAMHLLAVVMKNFGVEVAVAKPSRGEAQGGQVTHLDCPTCGEFKLNEHHRCPPEWLVWSLDYGGTEEDAIPLRASRPDKAAEEWAKRSDRTSADYSIVGGSDATVLVRDTGSREVFRYLVSGETVPSYSARLVKEGT